MQRIELQARRAVGDEPLPNPHLSGQDLAYYRDVYVAKYRRLVGVHPKDRARLRSQLENVEQTGGKTIEEAIQAVRAVVNDLDVPDASPSGLLFS